MILLHSFLLSKQRVKEKYRISVLYGFLNHDHICWITWVIKSWCLINDPPSSLMSIVNKKETKISQNIWYLVQALSNNPPPTHIIFRRLRETQFTNKIRKETSKEIVSTLDSMPQSFSVYQCRLCFNYWLILIYISLIISDIEAPETRY